MGYGYLYCFSKLNETLDSLPFLLVKGFVVLMRAREHVSTKDV